MNKEPLSEKVKAKSLILDYSLNSAFLVPVVILHSPRFNTYAAIGNGFHEVFRRSMTLSKRVEWMNAESINKDLGKGYPWPALAVYLHPEADHLRLIADYFNMLRPDIMVEIMDKADWKETGSLQQVMRHREVFKPRLGSLVFCRHAALEVPGPETVPPVAMEQGQPAGEAAGEQPQQSGVAAQPSVEVPPDIRIFHAEFDTAELGKLLDVMEAAGAEIHSWKVNESMEDDGFLTVN
jgi:hypothetical protein